MKAARALECHQESQIPPKKGFFPPARNAAPCGSTLLIPLATGGGRRGPAASGRDALRRRVKCRRRSVSLMSGIADRIEECGCRRWRDAPRPAGVGSCGGDVTLPGAARRVTAVDCEAGSAVAGGAVTLPAGRRRLV